MLSNGVYDRHATYVISNWYKSNRDSALLGRPSKRYNRRLTFHAPSSHFTMGVAAMLRMAQEALTFDDVLLVPGFSDILPKDVSLKTRLTRNLFLNIPLLSAAMDTVTEARLAIAMAQEGGIGIIHKNMTMAQQAAEVRKVKKHESVIVKDPVTVSPKAKLEDLPGHGPRKRLLRLPGGGR